jgi:trans-L-3-hydroxyproline dehydratase
MNWTPPANRISIRTVEAHAEGEPLRVVISGIGPVMGSTILERRRYARERLDNLRKALIFEPRGHAGMYGALVTSPTTAEGDLGVLFMHNEGWSTMCGHGIIALTTVAVETEMISKRELVRLDTPAGRVVARPRISNGRVTSVTFENVPSFVVALDQTVQVPGLGEIRYDLAFGGAFYAYVEAKDLGVEITAKDLRLLIERGMAVKRAVADSNPIQHPLEEDMSFLSGVIIAGPPHSEEAHTRNVCIFAGGEVDRSPTGTGVSGRAALEYARGRLKEDEPFIVESLIGTRFTGRVARTTTFGPYEAVIPEIEGRAWITGRNEFLIDPDDPLKEGFILS